VSEVRRRIVESVRGLRGDGRGWILASIASGWLLTLGLRFLVPAVIPQVKETFVVDNATAGIAVTVVWAFYALTQFPAGLITDRIGERTALAGSLAMSAASLAFLASAPVFAVFLVGAALFGIGSGFYGPARGTALSRAFPARAGAAFGITLAAGSFGSAVLPLVAGVAVDELGWRMLVGGAVPLFLAVSVLAYRVLPEPIDEYAETTIDTGPTFTLREAVRRVPDAVRDRDVVLAILGLTFYLFAFQGLTAFLPTYLVDVEGIGQGVASGVFALLFVGGGLTQLAAGSLSDRYGTVPVLVVAAGFGALTLFAVPFVDSLAAWAVLSFLLGTRMGIAPVANSSVIAALPTDAQGASWGFLRTCFFLVSATGSAFVGAMADADLFDESFLVLGVLTACAAVCFQRLGATR